MSAPINQPSFSSGELAPQLEARVDLAQFHSGVARAYNAYVDYRGGLTSRPGTKLVNAAGDQDPTHKVRLIKFQFSVLQTYMLEFGDHYMRVIKNGGIVAPGGTPYVLTTPWAQADLATLKFAQSNDVMTLTHPNYPPYDLTRLADNNWTIAQLSFNPTVGRPTITSVVEAGSPASSSPVVYTDFIYDYVVTTVGADGSESQQSDRKYLRTFSFEDIKQTLTVSWTYDSQARYYNVYKARNYTAARANATDFPPFGQTYGFIGSSFGTSFPDTNVVPDFSKTPPRHRDPFAKLGITSVTVTNGGLGYGGNAYINVPDASGTGARLVPIISNDGIVTGVQILDGGSGYTAPTIQVLGGGSGATFTVTLGPATGTYPGVVTYFQQRKVFAASLRQPATYWATRNGLFTNMDITVPTVDSDALTFTLAALEQNPIKYMIPMQNGLVMLTGGAAWLISGGDNKAALTPTAVSQTPQVYNGCADVLPLVIGYNILYVQEKGYVVQDIKFDFFAAVYTGEDRTYLSSHFFEGRTVVEWCWAEQPHKLVWAVMSDGKLISMTYIPEQKVYGWTQHETAGFVESISSCPEDTRDSVYVVVRRATGRFIERFEARQGWKTAADAWALDCALRYQGAPAGMISSLTHLAGQTVTVFADGVGPTTLTVTAGGQLVLPVAASNVLIGLPFVAEMQSMYLDTQVSPTPQGRRKFLPAVTVRLVESKGLNAGRTFDNMVPVKDYASDLLLRTEDQRVNLSTGWESNGQVCLRGTVGLPWSVTALIPEVNFGD